MRFAQTTHARSSVTPRLYRTTRPLAVRAPLRCLIWASPVLLTRLPSAFDPTLCGGADPLGWASDADTRGALSFRSGLASALNRLLRAMPLSTRTLMGLLDHLSARGATQEEDGYPCLDDVVIEKAFARKLPWAGWTYSFAKKRKVYRLPVVVLLWCANSTGVFVFWAGFRLWRPKRSCARARLPNQAQAGGGHAQGGHRLGASLSLHSLRHPLQRRVVHQDGKSRLDLIWCGTLHPRTIVFWRAKRGSVSELARALPLK